MHVPIVRNAPANDAAAAQNRDYFERAGLVCVHLYGAAGSGKTALLEAILPRLAAQLRVGVVQGDLVGTGDGLRLAVLGVPVVQVLTDGYFCLRPHQLQHALAELPLDRLDLLLVEDVGVPLGPGTTDLGEHLKAAVFSVTHGTGLVRKFPDMAADAALVLFNKHALLSETDFDIDATAAAIRERNPLAEIICTDVRRRIGIDRTAGWLLGYVRAQRLGTTGRQGTAPRLAAMHAAEH